MQKDVYALAETLGQTLREHRMRLVVAESCTGGWLSKVLTDVPGSSDWFEAGLVTYSNLAKQTLLAVPEDLLETEGAVSAAVVAAMAEGALRPFNAHLSVAISGIAGPEGGSPDKPVGTVWFAWASVIPGKMRVKCEQFNGDRKTIRLLSVQTALKGLLSLVEQKTGGLV